uniref:Glutaredoxin domain-containing protein n=1 Tax=Gongylonema pulchrum TaxID=637853 RepID=A0A183EC65_9BILA
LVHFSAKWSEACQQLNSFLVELKDELKCFDYGVVEADESPLITCAFSVDAAPTKDKEVDRLKGFDPGELKQKIMQHNFVEGVAAMTREAEDENEKEVLNSKLKALINRAPLMLFMKGTPDFPKCGFSNQMVNVLREVGANFVSFDVLENEEVEADPFYYRFSNQMVNVLREVGASFVSFDVLENEEVRQGLKKYSQWPTYPQLYLHGELIGGLDIVKECVKDADFCEKLPKVKV